MNGHFVHPFDDDRFIAGNGTVGLEILEDLPDVDAIVAPLGGGGLLAGIAAAVARSASRRRVSSPRSRKPPRRWPRRWPPARRCTSTAGRRRSWTAPAASRCSTTMWPLLRALAGSIVVSLDDVARAMRLVAERAHVIAEGAAGCAVAAALSGRAGNRQGRRRRVGRQHRPRDDSPSLVGACDAHMNHESSIRYSTLSPLPERISRLDELAVDLWWSWHADARAVFRRLDYTLWRATAHNPVRMLWLIPRQKLEAAAQRSRVPARCTTAPSRRSTRRAAAGTPGGRRAFRSFEHQSIAYFSAEFALHQSLPIYAGGLGVLAGDHCKEASDLGVPLIGVGFMYPQGYFHQHVSAEGWQEESYERLNWADAPIEPATDARRQAVHHRGAARRSHGARGGLARASRPREAVPARHRSRGERAVGSRAVGAALRRRSRDAHPAGNHPRHRRRPRAEGARVGSGGLPPERRPRRRSSSCSGSATSSSRARASTHALEEIRATTVFTTHTPVPAGHDAFPFHLVEKHLAGCWGTLGVEPRSVPGARRRTTTAAARSST